MPDGPEAGTLEQFIAVRGDRLMRTAALLAGGREAGEDLLQAALERLLSRRRPLEGDPEAYLRRIMANLVIDGARRAGTWQRKLLLIRPAAAMPDDPMSVIDLRDALVRAVLQLPPRQRAVIVLRYWEQMSEAEAAAELGWPEGTVKSTMARGMGRLREIAGSWESVEERTT